MPRAAFRIVHSALAFSTAHVSPGLKHSLNPFYRVSQLEIGIPVLSDRVSELHSHFVSDVTTAVMIDIDQAGDFVVRATEKAHSENGRTIPSRAQEFRVRKDVLIKASEPWKDMLVTQGQAPASKVVRDFCNGPILSTEILLRGLHEAVDVDSYDASIKAVW